MLGTGGSRFGGVKEEGSGSGGIGQIGGDVRGGGDVSRNDDMPGMRAEVQISSLT